MTREDAEAMHRRLGVFDFAKPDERYLVASLPDRSGQVSLLVENDRVADIHNYCWSLGGDCTILEVSD